MMDQRWDFFISYTGAEQAWAEWIAETLEQAGHTTLLQAWDFRPGSDFVEQMHQAIEQTKRTITVLSQRYLVSVFAAAEWHAIFAKDPTGQAGLLVPVRIEDCEPPGLLRTRVFIDLVGLDEQAAAARLGAGVGRGRAKPAGRRPYPGGPPTAGGVSFPGRPPAVFNVPPRNPHFAGRSGLLAALRQQLAETSTGAVVQAGAVHGLGGVGKTQLVIEYAHRYGAEYDLVWWIPAEEPAAIGGRLAALARRLGLPELPSLEEQIQVLFDALGQRQRWLLVYDNATDPHSLDGLRPPAGHGHLLITSRNPAWGGIAAPVRVDVLGRGEAVSFLRKRLGREDPALGQLAEALGDLPLALEQAAAYIEETATTLAGYLTLLAERATELLALGQPTDSEHTIATTWTVALQRLGNDAPAAADLLRLCAFLAPDDLPLSVLTGHPDHLAEPLASTVGDPLGLQLTLGALRRYSLLVVSGDSVSVHRLVQAVTRQQLDRDQQNKSAITALRLVSAAFPDHSDESKTWPHCARLLAHVLAVTDHARAGQVDAQTTASLLTEAGRYLWSRAELQQAQIMNERALSIREAYLGAEHPDTATSVEALGVVLHNQGNLNRARTLYERALSIRETYLGNNHLDTARSLGNLAYVLRDQGDLQGARRLFERALSIREARLGADHPTTARSLGNLGVVLDEQGDLQSARTLFERALAIHEARRGPDHPDTARSLNNLAGILHAQGDLAGARTLYERALAIHEARLSPDHPDTMRSRERLAAVVAALENRE